MSRRRVLVTGAGGFVGANLARSLADDGHAVTATTRPGSSPWRLRNADGLDMRLLDVGDDQAVAALIDDVRPQWLLHMAAHGAYSWQTDARQIIATNVLGTVNLVDACRRCGACEAFVHAGSSSEYGYKDHAPDEDEALAPASDYAVAKAAATLYGRQAASDGDAMRVITLRLYSVYGPWEDPRRLVPALIVRGLRGELPPLVDPGIARDFVAVQDVVRAFVLAAAEAAHGTVYNVGSARQTTIREIVQLTRAALDIEAEPQWASTSQRSWDTKTWVSCTDRIRHDLQWEPQISLDEGLRTMAAWLRDADDEVARLYEAAHPDQSGKLAP